MRTRSPKFFLLVYLDNQYSLEGPVLTDEDWNDAIDLARPEGNRCHLYISRDPLVRIDSEKSVKEFVNSAYRAKEVPSGTLLRCGDERPHEEAIKKQLSEQKERKAAWKKCEAEMRAAKDALMQEQISFQIYDGPIEQPAPQPYYIVIQDFDKSEFSVEGPMLDDEDWTTAVIEAQEQGRRINFQIYDDHRFDYRACVEQCQKDGYVSKRAYPGTIVRTPTFEVDYPHYRE